MRIAGQLFISIFHLLVFFTKVALKLASVRFKKYGVMLKRRVGGR